jgi:hypothetical protein
MAEDIKFPGAPEIAPDTAEKAMEPFIIQYLLEHEVIDHPAVKVALIANIYGASPHIADAEFVADAFDRTMLIWIKVKGWAKLFKKEKEIASKILDVLSHALPKFEFRVTLDKTVFDKGVARAQKLAIQRAGGGIIKKKEESSK